MDLYRIYFGPIFCALVFHVAQNLETAQCVKWWSDLLTGPGSQESWFSSRKIVLSFWGRNINVVGWSSTDFSFSSVKTSGHIFSFPSLRLAPLPHRPHYSDRKYIFLRERKGGMGVGGSGACGVVGGLVSSTLMRLWSLSKRGTAFRLQVQGAFALESPPCPLADRLSVSLLLNKGSKAIWCASPFNLDIPWWVTKLRTGMLSFLEP